MDGYQRLVVQALKTVDDWLNKAVEQGQLDSNNI